MDKIKVDSAKVFTAINKPHQISSLIESQIENAIRSRTYPPGSKLPTEFELCEQFGVSRTAIREALRMLSARGLITVMKGKGVFVRTISAETVTNPFQLYLQMMSTRNHFLDIIHARQIIEPPVAASAALQHTEEDAALLKKDLQDLIDSPDDHAVWAKLDMSFHLDVARSSENEFIPLILDPIHRLMPEIKAQIYNSVDNAKESAIEWHGKIVEAILSRDPEKAREAMEGHLKIAEEHLVRTLKSAENTNHRHSVVVP